MEAVGLNDCWLHGVPETQTHTVQKAVQRDVLPKGLADFWCCFCVSCDVKRSESLTESDHDVLGTFF